MSDFDPPPPPPAYEGAPETFRPTGTNGKAIASLVCGIVGLVLFGVILGPIAIIFGVIARNETAHTGQAGRGMATAGLILGIIDVAFFFLFLAVVMN